MAKATTPTSANLGFEDKLWAAADKLRGNMDAAKFVQSHASSNGNGKKPKVGPAVRRDISIYGQESNNTTWRLALMNLAIRGIDGKIEWGDSFLNDKHKDMKADYILANPPFNMEDWGYSKVKNDVRWRRFDLPAPGETRQAGQPSGNAQFSLPPGGERKRKDGSTFTVDGGNANYAWILHFLHHLAPHGTAGFVLANGSLTSNTSGEGDIRKAIIEAHGHVLTPGRYVGTEEVEDDGVPFEEKMAELSAELYEQMIECVALDAAIRKNLEALGYGE